MRLCPGSCPNTGNIRELIKPSLAIAVAQAPILILKGIPLAMQVPTAGCTSVLVFTKDGPLRVQLGRSVSQPWNFSFCEAFVPNAYTTLWQTKKKQRCGFRQTGVRRSGQIPAFINQCGNKGRKDLSHMRFVGNNTSTRTKRKKQESAFGIHRCPRNHTLPTESGSCLIFCMCVLM